MDNSKKTQDPFDCRIPSNYSNLDPVFQKIYSLVNPLQKENSPCAFQNIGKYFLIVKSGCYFPSAFRNFAKVFTAMI